MAEMRAFHPAVLARSSSSESDWYSCSSSLILRTIGIMRLISRWFFEPMIFLMMKLTIETPAPGRENDQNIRPPRPRKENWGLRTCPKRPAA